MALFALEYRFGPDRDRRLQVRPEHRAYLERLNAQGDVVAAGPFADDAGALIIYEVSDRAELEHILRDDPYIQQDVFGDLAVHEWQPFIGGALEPHEPPNVPSGDPPRP
jgi:uncharacterized protein YciI